MYLTKDTGPGPPAAGTPQAREQHACRESTPSHRTIDTLVNGKIPAKAFLDSGSTSCWAKRALVTRAQLVMREAPEVTYMTGIGHGHHVISHDVDIPFSINGVPTSTVCGVIADDVMPGDFILGQRFLDRAGSMFLPGRNKAEGRICFTLLPGRPTVTAKPIADHRVLLACDSPSTLPPEVEKLQIDFPSVFSEPTGLPPDSGIHHKITTTGTPIKQRLRQYSPRMLKALDDFVTARLKDKYIRRSDSPWSSCPTFAAKPDGSLRVCVDYRMLNAVTRKNAYPLPNMRAALQSACGQQWYSVLDLKDGFYQLRLAKDSIEKTAFSTPRGHFEFLVLPFGLTNAPATFQQLMDRTLEPCANFATCYLDDICVFSQTRAEHAVHLRKVLHQLAKSNLHLNLKKCQWFQNKVKFLGLYISPHGIATDPAKVQAVRDRRAPRTVTEIRGFLNAAGFFRRFIKDFAKVAKPLADELKGNGKPGTPVTLTADQLQAYSTLRDLLLKAPVMRPFDFSRPVVIDTDSSQYCTGAVLLQPYQSDDPGHAQRLCAVAYDSRMLDETQQRYSAQERELLAIVRALQQWREWVEGLSITIRTDHQSLTLIRTKRELPARIIRFLSIIEHFNPVIIYRLGSSNHVPDWLSRPPQVFPISTSRHPRRKHARRPQTPVEIALSDPEPITPVASRPSTPPPRRSANPRSSNSPAQSTRKADTHRVPTMLEVELIADHLLRQQPLNINRDKAWVHSHFFVHDGELYYRRDTTLLRVLEHEAYLQHAKRTHVQAGHCSIGALQRLMSRNFWHPDDVLLTQEVIRDCPTCALSKRPAPAARLIAPLSPVPPFTRWGLDFCGPIRLPSSNGPNNAQYLLNAIDYCTSWAVSRACASPTAEGVIDMYQHIRSTYGIPREIICDNGAAFIARTLQAVLQQDGVKCFHSTPYHPQTNGKVERFNGQLKAIINSMARDAPVGTPWEALLQHALLKYRTTPLVSGHTPYFLVFGTETSRSSPEHANSASFAVYEHEPTEDDEKASAAVRAHDIKEILLHRNNVNSARFARDMTRAYLQQGKELSNCFSRGDWVLRARKRRHKHEPFYDGPHRVVDTHDGNTYSLETVNGMPIPGRTTGSRMFPAYVDDGHPITSPWYGSRRLLNLDRQRYEQRLEGEATSGRGARQKQASSAVEKQQAAASCMDTDSELDDDDEEEEDALNLYD